MARSKRVETEDEELARLLGTIDLAPAAIAPTIAAATVPDLPTAYLAARDVPRHFLTDHLPHIERMAAQQMDAGQIAARLGYSERVLSDAAARFEDVLLALTGGRARGIDEISGALYRNAMIGETAAQTFILRTRGGYTTGAERGADKPSDTGARTIEITLDNINGLAERQRALQAPETGAGRPETGAGRP